MSTQHEVFLKAIIKSCFALFIFLRCIRFDYCILNTDRRISFSIYSPESLRVFYTWLQKKNKYILRQSIPFISACFDSHPITTETAFNTLRQAPMCLFVLMIVSNSFGNVLIFASCSRGEARVVVLDVTFAVTRCDGDGGSSSLA